MRDKEDLKMSLIFIGKMNTPNYIAESTDITNDGNIVGASIIGATVLLTDTGVWKVILPDMTLEDYALPISFNGSVDIGAVHIDQQLTESVEIVPLYDTKTVAVPGTAESLEAVDTYAVSIGVFPLTGNAGAVYFGNSGVDRITSKQLIVTDSPVYMDAPLGYKLNLKTLFIDADEAGDGVYYVYLA